MRFYVRLSERAFVAAMISRYNSFVRLYSGSECSGETFFNKLYLH